MGTRKCLKGGCEAGAEFANNRKDCADHNMRAVVTSLGLSLDQVLIVGTQSARTGFYGLAPTELKSTGLHETQTDYAAFFAPVSEGVSLITHMADCGFVVAEFPGVFGFLHLTRLNMAENSTAARDFVHAALAHYGGRIEDVRLTLVAAVRGENYPQHFTDLPGHRPDDRFPGWFEAGLLTNLSKPDWRAGDPLNAADRWLPDNRAMMRRLLLRTGISPAQLTDHAVLDPGDLRLGHASHGAGMRGHIPIARDAYIVTPASVG